MVRIRIMVLFLVLGCLGLISCRRGDRPDSGTPAGGADTISSFDGTPLHYQVQGEGDIALVFLHDWCTDMSYWRKQIPSFRVYYKVITLDFPGHGKSGKERKDWTLTSFARDAAAVVTELDLKQVVLVGHGMGGPVAVMTVPLVPDRIIGVMGVNSFTDIYMESYGEEQITTMLGIFRPDFSEGMRKYVLENYFIPQAPEDFKLEVIKKMAAAPPDQALAVLEDLMKFDGGTAVQGLNIPIRSLNAEDPILPFRIIRRQAQDFAVRFVKNTGHFVMWDNPNEFNRYMSTFLGDIITASYQNR